MDDYRVGVLVYVIYTYYLIFTTSINYGLVSAWRHLWSCFFSRPEVPNPSTVRPVFAVLPKI
jgi:hypothetical protein